MNLPVSPDDSRAFLLAIGLGAIVGVMFGGWIMTALHRLMMALVKLTLFGAVMVIGIFLWNGYQASRPPQYAPSMQTYQALPRALPTRYPTYQEPAVAPSSERWWEQ